MMVHVVGDLKCQVCQIFFTKPSLDYHYRRFHPDLYVTKETHKLQCEKCKLVCSDAGRLSKKLKGI